MKQIYSENMQYDRKGLATADKSTMGSIEIQNRDAAIV